MYTDQTGAFPVTTKKGNKYIMIICEIDNNVIISEAMFNRIQASHKSKWIRVWASSKRPTQKNISERALQTWKAHTIGALSGVSDTLPLGLWDKLLPQLDKQVNLLRFSNIYPKACSWTVLNGAHDFNKHPLAPLGAEIQMLENPQSLCDVSSIPPYLSHFTHLVKVTGAMFPLYIPVDYFHWYHTITLAYIIPV